MKIEVGESLIYSWLRHVKNCKLVQTNWKVSSTWNNGSAVNEHTKALFAKIKAHTELADVFTTDLDQTLKQAETDVIGLDDRNTVYLVEIAYHENGLHYGSKEETKNRVCKKLLRAYLIGTEFFPNKRYNIIFASPKTNPADNKIISDYFETINTEFNNANVSFHFYTNDDFKNEILIPTITKTEREADTAELFLRSYKLLDMFSLVLLPKETVSAPAGTPNTVQQPYVTIKNMRIDTHPQAGESMQDFVKRTFSQLIENHLLDDAVLQQLLDRQFCRTAFGIDYALLQTDRNNCFDNTGHPRYWNRFRIANTYFCCSEWWRDLFPHYEERLAAWLQSLADT